MEIDITYLTDVDVARFSASVAETGRANAGGWTWHNAMEETRRDKPGRNKRLCNAAGAMVDYFEEFGAWTRAELVKMGITKLNTLLLQYISGNLREMGDLKDDALPFGMDWKAIEEAVTAGQISGSIYPSKDGQTLYFSMSH